MTRTPSAKDKKKEVDVSPEKMEGRWEGRGKWESRPDCGWNVLEIMSYWGQCPVFCLFGTMDERCCFLRSCSGPFVPINHNSSTRMSRHGTRASCLEMKAGERLYLSLCCSWKWCYEDIFRWHHYVSHGRFKALLHWRPIVGFVLAHHYRITFT